MTKNFNILVNKLNAFKFRYYSYKLIKGVILTCLLLISLYTIFSVLEYFVYLSGELRKVIFYGYVFFALLLIVQFILVVLLKLVHVLKPLDTRSVTYLIQKHFSEIEDKLLNIIELASIANSSYSDEIVLASIDQKIDELKLFDFKEAVQFKNLKVILFYFTFSFILTGTIFIINKKVFTDSTQRIVHYNQQYIKPAPYRFNINTNALEVKKGDPFLVEMNCSGNEIPEIIYINIEGNNYLMKSRGGGAFEFEIASVINSLNFYFTDLKFNSEKFLLKLLPKPGITSFVVKLFPPAYTNLQNKEFINIGDIQVPHGTKVQWTFQGIDVDSLFLTPGETTTLTAAATDRQFNVEHTFLQSSSYNVFIQNQQSVPELALSYQVEVIPDLFPEIDIVKQIDSMNISRFFFKGLIGDDYGFSKLNFHYNIDNQDSIVNIPFVKSLNTQSFYFSFDFMDLNLSSGLISYYFSVSDNDLINGYKTTTSDSFVFEIPDKNKINEKDKKQFRNIENLIDESRELTKDIQKDLNNLQIKNMDSNISEWEKSQMVSDVISKQNKLENLYEQIKKDNEKLNNYLNSFNKQNEDIIEKQKQIEDLLEDVFTDELKKLMEEFNTLAEEFDSKNLNRLKEQMDLSFEDLQKQLDRNLEMLRKMKIEQKLQNVIDEINKTAKEELSLAGELEENKNFDEIKEKVDAHKKTLNQLKENIAEALEMNKELKQPINFDDFDEDFQEIDKGIDETLLNLDKKNRRKSSSGMKKSSEQLENMAFGMQQMLNSNSMKQNMENLENLKQILSNLMFMSFEQEEIVTNLSGMSTIDPQLVELNVKQKQIGDMSKIVKDSLYALAMRTPAVTNKINNELLSMELHLVKAGEQMEEGLLGNARMSQLFVVTAANNLALLLNEALEHLEEQMANAQPGDQSCENPGNNPGGMGKAKEASEGIKQQLQKMIDQMKQGKGKNMSQQLGESLMQHEMMQQMLREMMNNGSVGSGSKNILKQIDKMLDQNRKELMSKSISAQTIARQNQITTRLLEAEMAEIERDYEDKRESESAEEFYSNPIKFFEYKQNENYSIEYLNKNTHQLNNFYNNKYKKYINSIQEKL